MFGEAGCCWANATQVRTNSSTTAARSDGKTFFMTAASVVPGNPAEGRQIPRTKNPKGASILAEILSDMAAYMFPNILRMKGGRAVLRLLLGLCVLAWGASAQTPSGSTQQQPQGQAQQPEVPGAGGPQGGVGPI